ncbi:MAG: alpha/beta hydrolase [Alphaproteobacteria bacterium]|nr:alpha/beta hydrolase [Alphaproteobacteria bacterium]
MNPDRLYTFPAPNPEGEGTHPLAIHEWGEPTNPDVVICVHGLTRNARDFDFLAAALAPKYRVIAPDIAGRGDSPPLPNPAWYTNPVSAADMLALMKQLNIESCRWVGTSMGGIIGMILAATHPKKIKKLVLNDIGAELPKEGLHFISQYVGRFMEFPDEASYRAFVTATYTDFLRGGLQIAEHVFQHSASRQPDGSYRLRYDPKIGDVFRAANSPEMLKQDIPLWEIWDKIACPVLLLHGANSNILTAATAQKMTQTGPRATLVTYPGIGHCPSLMEADQIQTVTEWLEK